jgi:protein-L-isoaspartate(D-aspartate) O-methyltransferase
LREWNKREKHYGITVWWKKGNLGYNVLKVMTDLVGLKPDHVVLEVGTGSGYQAAVLARLAGKVYTLEIIAALGKEAEERLKRMGFGNCEVRIGDGYYGWKDHAPFDAIVVTAAASHIPPPLAEMILCCQVTCRKVP